MEESYEPTAARKREIVQANIRGCFEALFSLQAQHRVAVRLKSQEQQRQIEKMMAEQEEAIAELHLFLEEMGASDAQGSPAEVRS
jgi:hypothetical protein